MKDVIKIFIICIVIILLYIGVAGCVSAKPVVEKPKPVKNWIYKLQPVTVDGDSLKAVIMK